LRPTALATKAFHIHVGSDLDDMNAYFWEYTIIPKTVTNSNSKPNILQTQIVRPKGW